MEKRKRKIWQVLICIGLLCVIWGGYFVSLKLLERNIDYVRDDDYSWVIQVDEVIAEDSSLVLKGFAFHLKQDAVENAFDIILYNMDTDKFYYPKMEYGEREDVNEYFLCEFDYTKSGFVATIESDKLDLKKQDYEVLLRPKGSRRPYHIATFLSKGKLMYVNPEKYSPLEEIGMEIKGIVENGVLKVYRPDMGVYVYQVGQELYWITDDVYVFEPDKTTYLEYHLNTTQIQNLPQERLENGWYWSNLRFIFENNIVIDSGSFRVTKCSLPSEYSITEIWTGYHVNDWIWEEHFRPWYDFE